MHRTNRTAILGKVNNFLVESPADIFYFKSHFILIFNTKIQFNEILFFFILIRKKIESLELNMTIRCRLIIS